MNNDSFKLACKLVLLQLVLSICLLFGVFWFMARHSFVKVNGDGNTIHLSLGNRVYVTTGVKHE